MIDVIRCANSETFRVVLSAISHHGGVPFFATLGVI